jgi:PAS domain S-box-containing protein
MAEHQHASGERPDSRLEFETLLADLSSRFINLPPDQVDREINDALRRVCELLGIDLAVLWQWPGPAPDVIIATHFHSAEDAQPPAGPLSEEQFPWARKEVLAGRVVLLRSLDDFPAEAAIDRESCRLLGINSNLTLPLAVAGAPPVGALGLNTRQAHHDWPDALIARLTLVAQVFTNALARRRADESLRESEERLALAVDSAQAGLWVLDYRTGVFWATERGRAIFGYSPDERIDMARLEASVHPDDRESVRGAIERSQRAGEPVDVEYRIILPGEGKERWIASRGRPRLDAAGRPERLMGISIDITDRKRAEDSLRTSEARLAAGAELAGLAYVEVDEGTGEVFTDDRLREFLGIPPDRVGLQIVEFWKEHLHPDDASFVLGERRQAIDGERDELRVEYRYLHPVRGEMWIQHLGRATTRDGTNFAVRSFGALRDITESKRAEESLLDLSRRLIQAHEEERALLARELHDDLTQRLAVLAIDAGRAELAATDRAQALELKSVREGLVRVSEDIHSLAYQLHPSVLDELGLAAALRAECDRLGRQGSIDLALELDPLPAVVDRDAALCLFRVAQEALNNVNRHAGARAASVTLRQMDGGLLLAVRDDGSGFDPATPRKARSLGLASMRERVRLVGGTLDVESAPGRGTAIIAWVPTEGRSG